MLARTRILTALTAALFSLSARATTFVDEPQVGETLLLPFNSTLAKILNVVLPAKVIDADDAIGFEGGIVKEGLVVTPPSTVGYIVTCTTTSLQGRGPCPTKWFQGCKVVAIEDFVASKAVVSNGALLAETAKMLDEVPDPIVVERPFCGRAGCD